MVGVKEEDKMPGWTQQVLGANFPGSERIYPTSKSICKSAKP